MNLNGIEYYYVTNMQGDIIELVAGDGTIVVSYKYDAWGNIIGTPFDISNVDLANKNPYRYRGYRYDNETGFYYLQSRYYNPEIGRFINSDSLIGTRGEILSHNLYAYCANNPVMNIDPMGYWSWRKFFQAASAAVAAVASVAAVIITAGAAIPCLLVTYGVATLISGAIDSYAEYNELQAKKEIMEKNHKYNIMLYSKYGEGADFIQQPGLSKEENIQHIEHSFILLGDLSKKYEKYESIKLPGNDRMGVYIKEKTDFHIIDRIIFYWYEELLRKVPSYGTT